MRCCVAVLALVSMAAPAAAQSTYVGASLVADIARLSKVDYDDDFARFAGLPSLDGEALGLSVRVGRGLGERWGVELEFARSGEIENRHRPFAIPVPAIPIPEVAAILPPFPNFNFEIETQQRHQSLSALLWVRQELGDRVELAYLGGVAFGRAEFEQDFGATNRDSVLFTPFVAPEYTTIEHYVAPAIGLEADIKFGDRAALTTGVRVQGASVSGRNGWLIRPNVGVRWRF